MPRFTSSLLLAIFGLLSLSLSAYAAQPTNARPPQSPAELKYWLENMVWHHDYSIDEIQAATGLPPTSVLAAQRQWDIYPETRPELSTEKLLVLPYPGGRHPRITFLEGAVEPQRETKVSVFLPWAPREYVVCDVPEAIWSNLGLTYLAHTHVETVWEKEEIALEPLEWTRNEDGTFTMERTLPNGIRFGTHVVPRKDRVSMQMWLHNGTDELLTGMRVQNCVMLKSATEFNQLIRENKIDRNPYAIVHNPEKTRWIISAWTPCFRPWGNGRCPCLHSDPKFPDCAPGETKVLNGWLSFYEGTDIDAELERITATGWQTDDSIAVPVGKEQ